MKKIIRMAIGSGIAMAVLLFLLFGGGAMLGEALSSGMMGDSIMGTMGSIGWMWIPVLLMLVLLVLIVWVIFGQRK